MDDPEKSFEIDSTVVNALNGLVDDYTRVSHYTRGSVYPVERLLGYVKIPPRALFSYDEDQVGFFVSCLYLGAQEELRRHYEQGEDEEFFLLMYRDKIERVLRVREPGNRFNRRALRDLRDLLQQVNRLLNDDEPVGGEENAPDVSIHSETARYARQARPLLKKYPTIEALFNKLAEDEGVSRQTIYKWLCLKNPSFHPDSSITAEERFKVLETSILHILSLDGENGQNEGK